MLNGVTDCTYYVVADKTVFHNHATAKLRPVKYYVTSSPFATTTIFSTSRLSDERNFLCSNVFTLRR